MLGTVNNKLKLKKSILIFAGIPADKLEDSFIHRNELNLIQLNFVI